MNIVEHWLWAVAEFNITFKLTYLSVVTVLTILINCVLSDFVFEFPVEYISYGFFFLFFLIWVYRIMLSDLRADKKGVVTKKEKRWFLFITFVDVLILNFWFLDSEFNFLYLLIAMFGCSFLLWLIFMLLDRFILNDSEVRIYFRILTFVIFINILLHFSFNFLKT
jgi:hypothetical protein